jgi:ribose transport system ATP-binding protein
LESIIEFQNISKSFFGVAALTDVSFNVRCNTTIGLIGENGAGKSTLMNILGGAYATDGGEMRLNGQSFTPKNPAEASSAGIAFIHQELNLFINMTIADNIFIDRYPRHSGLPLIDKKEMRRQTQSLLAALELNLAPDLPVERLQPGERQMIEICKALHIGANVIIFDEPTTSLTTRESEKLFAIIQSLRKNGATIIYISHILKDIVAISDEIVVLRDGKVVDIGKTAEFTTQRMISSMCGCDLQQLFPERKGRAQETIKLEVKKLSSAGQIENVNMQVMTGEIIGLFGLMGSGRTELARLLFGVDRADAGEVTISFRSLKKPRPGKCINAGMAFVTENRREEGLLMDASVHDNLGLVSLSNYVRRTPRLLNLPKMSQAVTAQAKQVKLKSGLDLQTPVKNLSGGNQQKVVIGKWLLNHPEVFILDEPTRGIDVGAKFEVYSIINQLADAGAAVIFISSEIEELLGLCDRLLVLRNGEIVARFNHSEFEEKKILQAAFGE